MRTGRRVPAKYNLAVVEAAVLEVAAELHPLRLSSAALSGRVVGDPGDRREVEVVAEAMRNLHEFGLLKAGRGEIVEPTPTALHAVALLTR